MTEDRPKIKKAVAGAKNRASDKLRDLWWWFLVRGLLAIGLAVFALFWPEQTVTILVKLLGGYLIFDGVVGAVGAFRSGNKGGAPMLAIVGLVVGVVLLFWTGLTMRLFLILVGAWALLQGVGMFLSSRSKDSDPEAKKLVGIVGGVLGLAGLVLVVWPSTGIVTVSWLLAAIAAIVGGIMIFVAQRLRRLVIRVDGES